MKKFIKNELKKKSMKERWRRKKKKWIRRNLRRSIADKDVLVSLGPSELF